MIHQDPIPCHQQGQLQLDEVAQRPVQHDREYFQASNSLGILSLCFTTLIAKTFFLIVNLNFWLWSPPAICCIKQLPTFFFFYHLPCSGCSSLLGATRMCYNPATQHRLGMKVQCLPSLLANNCRAWRWKHSGDAASGSWHRGKWDATSSPAILQFLDSEWDFQGLPSLGLSGLSWDALRCPNWSCCVWQGSAPGVPLKVSYRYHKLCLDLERRNGVERRQALFTHRYLCSQQC